MSRVELIQMVSSDDKGLGKTDKPLSVLYRRVLYDRSVDSGMLLDRLDRWVHDPNNNSVIKTTKKITQARGNYIKKMVDPAMSWKSFADLMMMLYPVYIAIDLRLGWPELDADGNPKETKHSVKMDTAYLLDNFNYRDTLASVGSVISNYSVEGESDEDEGEPRPMFSEQLELFEREESDVADEEEDKQLGFDF